MFLVHKFLKTALKTYLGKYVLHESNLNNLKVGTDGHVELTDIELNCKEINVHLLPLGLKVDQFSMKKMDVTMNWEHIVDKLEFSGVIINLGVNDKSSNTELHFDVVPSTTTKMSNTNGNTANSVFFYTAENSLSFDSVLNETTRTPNSIPTQSDNKTDKDGYKMMFDSVEKIKNNFEVILNSIEVHMDTMWFAIDKIFFRQGDGEKTPNILRLEGVHLYNGKISVLFIPSVECDMMKTGCNVNINNDVRLEPECSLQHLAHVISVFFKYAKHLKSKEKEKESDEKKQIFICNIKKLHQFKNDNSIFEIDDLKIKIDPNDGSTNISTNSCKTPFINATHLHVDIIKKIVSPMPDDTEQLSPFSKNPIFYEDGSKKPESASTLEQRGEFCKQNKEYAKHYISIRSEVLDASDIKGFVGFCKDIYNTINQNKKIFHPNNSSDNENVENSNEIDEVEHNKEDEEAEGDPFRNNPKFFVEIHSKIVNIKLFNVTDQTSFNLHSTNTHIIVGAHFWSVQSKHIDLLLSDKSKSNILTSLEKIHIAGTLKLNHLVADIKHAQIRTLTQLAATFGPMLMVESEPMQMKMNIRISSVQGAEKMLNQTLYYQGQQCEFFTQDKMSTENIFCTVQSLLVDVNDYRLVDAKIIHLSSFTDVNKKVRVSLNKSDIWLCAKEFPEIVENLKHLKDTILKSIPFESGNNGGETFFDGENNEESGEREEEREDDEIEVERATLTVVEEYNPQTLEESKISQSPVWNLLKLEIVFNHLKLHLLESLELLGSGKSLRELNHVSVSFDYLRLLVFDDASPISIGSFDPSTQSPSQNIIDKKRYELMIQSFEIRDGIQTSLWNKAVWTGDIKIIYVDRYLSLSFGKEINLHVDQRLLDFVQNCMTVYTKSYNLIKHPNIIDSAMIDPDAAEFTSLKPPFRSIHISETVFRFDYKPQETGEMFSFINCMPIRDSKIVFNDFYLFQIKTWSTLMNELIVNLFSNIQNLQGIVSGIKPVRPIANIISNSKNLLILPINNHIGKKRSESFSKQIKSILKDVAVDVLELGSAVHMNINKQESIYANQPTNWKEGISEGKKQFSENCQTIIALVRNSEETDLMNLPIVVVRPFTGFVSQFFLGLANQLQPSRKQRMDNKYKTKIL